MSHNQQVGQWGELVVIEHLVLHECETGSRNVRPLYSEIDIIAGQGNITLFVEGKTRTLDKMGLLPEHFAAEHEIDHWQINISSIEGKPRTKPKVTYFANAI